MHNKQQNKTCFILETKALLKDFFNNCIFVFLLLYVLLISNKQLGK